jgi:hypothetical protein
VTWWAEVTELWEKVQRGKVRVFSISPFQNENPNPTLKHIREDSYWLPTSQLSYSSISSFKGRSHLRKAKGYFYNNSLLSGSQRSCCHLDWVL